MTTTAEALEAARKSLAENEYRVKAYQEKLRAEAKAVEMYQAKASFEEIEAATGLSRDQARRVLVAQGALKSRRRKLDPKETHEVISDLKSGLGIAETVEKRNVAESVVRRIAKENGIITARTRTATPKRTPAEIERLRALDAAVKKEFGAGLSALGEALRKANKDFVAAVEKTTTVPTETSVGEDEPFDTASEPAPPPVEALGPEHDEARGISGPREHHGDGDEPLPVEDDSADAEREAEARAEMDAAEAAMNEPDEVPW